MKEKSRCVKFRQGYGMEGGWHICFYIFNCLFTNRAGKGIMLL